MTKLKIIMGGAYRSYLIYYVLIHASNLKTILTFLVLFYFILPLLRKLMLLAIRSSLGLTERKKDYE